MYTCTICTWIHVTYAPAHICTWTHVPHALDKCKARSHLHPASITPHVTTLHHTTPHHNALHCTAPHTQPCTDSRGLKLIGEWGVVQELEGTLALRYMRTAFVGDICSIRRHRLFPFPRSTRLHRVKSSARPCTHDLIRPLPAPLTLLRRPDDTQQKAQLQFALDSLAVIHPASPEQIRTGRRQFEIETTLSFPLQRRRRPSSPSVS